MRRKFVSFISILVLLVSPMLSSAFTGAARASPDVIRVPEVHETIQAAIDAATQGDTIIVAPGTYYEHVVINKTLSLVGEDKETTIIDGNATGIVVKITQSNVKFTGFTVRRSGQSPWTASGIFLDSNSVNSNVSDNIVVNNYHGIYVEASEGNVISSNNISSNTGIAILMDFSWGNTISNNFVSQNEQDNGIDLFDSADNLITGNTFSSNGYAGIWLEESNRNIITANMISNNWLVGIYLKESSNNVLYHNNLIDNGLGKEGQLHNVASSNTWDNGAEGNYWSDYTGEDLNGDGIGDTNIPHLKVDSRPLMERWSSFRTFSVNGNIVTVLSNSTIASFSFNQSLARISFNATGAEGTLGFCNVTIPKNLLNVSGPPSKIWTVTIDGVFVSFAKTENTTHTSLYFTYAHTTHKVRIEVTEPKNIPPTADFIWSPANPTPYDTVNFNDNSTDSDGTIASWFWKFGDGTNSDEQNATHKYAIADTYVVTLKVTDNNGTETVTSKAISVRKVKTTMAVIAPSTVNSGELFTITATLKDESQDPVPDTTIMVYLLQEKWETIGFDTTNASGVASISYTPLLAPDKYRFRAFFNGTSIHAESSSTFTVEIIDTASPIADAGQNQTVHVGDLVIFNASGSSDNVGIISYDWDFEDGDTGTGMVTNHTYASTGKYTVTLTVKDAAGHPATDSITITVLPTEILPMWMIGVTLAFVGVTVVVIFLWRKRK